MLPLDVLFIFELMMVLEQECDRSEQAREVQYFQSRQMSLVDY